MGGRLTVGQSPLKRSILVRFQAPQPMKKNIDIKNLSIYQIRDVRTLVEKIYPSQSEFSFFYETRSINHTLEFEQELYKLPKPKEVKITKYPKSKEVKLHFKSEDALGYIVVQSTSNENLYSLLGYYMTGRQGYRSNNKFDRFRNLYLVYEDLEQNKEYKFTAVRHAISHPRLTQKVENEIMALFKNAKIDISNRRHAKILEKLHEELLKKTEKLLMENLISKINTSTKRIGHLAII